MLYTTIIRTCITCCFLLTTLAEKDDPFFRYDYVYDRGSGAFYKEHTERRTWQDAVDMCVAEGAQLATPIIEPEVRALLKRMSDGTTGVWLGIHDLFGEGHFVTLNGVPETEIYTNWYTNEPNNGIGNENCVMLLKFGAFNDGHCGDPLPFICKRDLISTPTYDAGASSPFFRKDYVYNGAFQSFYKQHKAFMTWADAVATCAGEGATLAAPDTAAERDAILYHLNPKTKSVWLGIHVDASGRFIALDAESSVFVDWDTSEPKDAKDGENCVVMAKSGLYNHQNCYLSHSFVCKKHLTALTTSNPLCDTFDTDYIYYFTTNRCYKYHTTPRTWHEAYKTCYDEGSYLGIINSAYEAYIHLEHIKKHQFKSDEERFDGQLIHSGFNDILYSGLFKTIKGEAVSRSGYREWATGQPENAGTNAHCGAMARQDGKLHAADCDTRATFICEKSLARALSLDATLRYGKGDLHLCVNTP